MTSKTRTTSANLNFALPIAWTVLSWKGGPESFGYGTFFMTRSSLSKTWISACSNYQEEDRTMRSEGMCRNVLEDLL